MNWDRLIKFNVWINHRAYIIWVEPLQKGIKFSTWKVRRLNRAVWLYNFRAVTRKIDTVNSETPPYGHLGNTVTPRYHGHFFLAAWQKPPYIFL